MKVEARGAAASSEVGEGPAASRSSNDKTDPSPAHAGAFEAEHPSEQEGGCAELELVGVPDPAYSEGHDEAGAVAPDPAGEAAVPANGEGLPVEAASPSDVAGLSGPETGEHAVPPPSEASASDEGEAAIASEGDAAAAPASGDDAFSEADNVPAAAAASEPPAAGIVESEAPAGAVRYGFRRNSDPAAVPSGHGSSRGADRTSRTVPSAERAPPSEPASLVAGLVDGPAKPITWTPALVDRFWNYVSASPLNELSFSKLNGPSVAFVFKPFLRKDHRYLDFGAGNGDFAKLMVAEGHRVGVYDPAADRQADGARMLENEPLFLGGVELGRDGNFDGVFMIEVVEHILEEELQRTFDQVRSLLKPDGLVFITTPNKEKLEAGISIDPISGAVFHRWQHVRCWTKESLASTLARFGFEAFVMHEVEFNDRIFDRNGAGIAFRSEHVGLFDTMRSVHLGDGSGLVCIARRQDKSKGGFSARFPRLWDRTDPVVVPLQVSVEPPRKSELEPSVNGWVLNGNTFEILLSPERLRQDGFGWAHPVPSAALGDSNDLPEQSRSWVFEDGTPLGPAHCSHSDVREHGTGRFSHWADTLLFSSSDNTSPLENGRTYSVRAVLDD